ncbi:hypothetical protein ACFQX6_65955 [Streptosporangium lutulentum]
MLDHPHPGIADLALALGLGVAGQPLGDPPGLYRSVFVGDGGRRLAHGPLAPGLGLSGLRQGLGRLPLGLADPHQRGVADGGGVPGVGAQCGGQRGQVGLHRAGRLQHRARGHRV